MEIPFPWSCPYCNRDTTITRLNFSQNIHFYDKNNKDGLSGLVTTVIVCPNKACKKYTIKGALHSAEYNGYTTKYKLDPKVKVRLEWNMKPKSIAKQFPAYIPKAIIADYEEACLIKELSPKASATLSRRCLQGMIRDSFPTVKKGRLVNEINAIQEKVDPTTWQAIDLVRKIGNIGAHMEKDINLIIEVGPKEAQLLIGLIEILIKDWYIAKHEREKELKGIIKLGDSKAEEKKSNKST